MRPLLFYVEDDTDDVFFVKRAFERSRPDVQMRFAQDGKEAIDYLILALLPENAETHPIPNLMLVDIRMPVLDGLEVLAWIRRHPRLERTPVVIMSSSDRPADQFRARELGADGYIIKHAQYRELPEFLARWL